MATYDIPSWVHHAARERIKHFEGIQSSASRADRYRGVIGEYIAQTAFKVNPEIDVRVRGKGGRPATLHFHADGYRSVPGSNAHTADFEWEGYPCEIKTARYLNRAELRALPSDTLLVRVSDLDTHGALYDAAVTVTATVSVMRVSDILSDPSLKWFDDNNRSADRNEPDGIRKQANITRLKWAVLA